MVLLAGVMGPPSCQAEPAQAVPIIDPRPSARRDLVRVQRRVLARVHAALFGQGDALGLPIAVTAVG